MNPSQLFTFTRTYSRWLPDEKRRETYEETGDRWLNFFSQELGDAIAPVHKSFAKKAWLNQEVMPSMRAAWAAGAAAKQNNITMYNCSFVVVNHPKVFSEILYILMCGTGVGFSVEKEHVDKLSPIFKSDTPLRVDISVQDSKEGWATSLEEVLSALWLGNDPVVDYSLVRPRGARLNTMGGRASGPEPLKNLVEYATQMFHGRKGQRLRPIDCHDLICKIAEIVVVGGVRRSSLISLSDLDDQKIATAKMGQFWDSSPHRSMSNNSAVYMGRPDEMTFMKEWLNLMESGSGERGIFNREGAAKQMLASGRRKAWKDIGTNPCVTGDTVIATLDGPRSFCELAKENKDVLVYAWSSQKMLPVVRWMRTPRKTRTNAELVQVVFDSGLRVRCTPNHNFYTFLGNKVMASELSVGQSVRAFFIDKLQVVSVTAAGSEDVYNGTVDEDHTYVILYPSPATGVASGVVSANCGEIILRDQEFCNLSEVVVRPEDTLETLRRKVRTAVMLGSWQATFTNFPYIRPTWKENCDEERLLGVSLTGVMDHPVLNNVNDTMKKWLGDMKGVALREADKWADRLNINLSTAITCGKPSGTVSQLVNCSSGTSHARHSEFYIRRYRISATDPLFRMMKDQGVPFSPEVGQSPDTASTFVLDFPVASPKGSKTRHDINAIQQLEHWRVIKEFWTEHNPSVTIYVDQNEWLSTGSWCYKNFDTLCGVSFLPKDTGVYQLAPYEEITGAQYAVLEAAFPKVDYAQLSRYEMEDNTIGSKSYACVGDSCEMQ